MTAPLEGIRVVDLGWSWAAPYAGMILADLGAEVIKVESSSRIDVMRWTPPFANGVVHHDRGGHYGVTNRGKLSVSLNLKSPMAQELVLELIAVSDVVLENFAPRVLPGLCLGPDAMLLRNPRIVIMSMSGYGPTGPDSSYLAYGDHINMASGMASITGYREDLPTNIGTFYGDPISGMYGALGVLAALDERDETGKGRHLTYAQVEGLTSVIPASFVRSSAGESIERMGAGSKVYAPQDYFPCLGDDVWVSLVVRSDEEWARLRALLSRQGIEALEAPTLEERLADSEAIQGAVTAWTIDRSAWEITHACQEIGVAAYPVLNAADLLWSDHLASRHFFQWVHHPVNGPGPVAGVTFRIQDEDESGSVVRGPAPSLGEHNEYVFQRLLGIEPERYEMLIANGAIS